MSIKRFPVILNRGLTIWPIVAVVGSLLLLLMPVVGATANGANTFLTSLVRPFMHDPSCVVLSDGNTACSMIYEVASNIGVGLCFMLGAILFVCIFQLTRLSVRKHLGSKLSR